jgi:heterodisulfide reductase subunit C
MDLPTVWVISSFPATRRVLGLNLSKRGFAIEEASRPDELSAAGAPPALIVIDIGAPGTLGWDAATAIRETPKLRRVPLILLVANAPTMSNLLSLRPARWVAEPVDADVLLREVWASLPQNYRRSEMTRSRTTLADRVRAVPGGEHLYMCYSCGTCVGACMIQLTGETSYNPRRLIQKVMNGIEAEAFEDRTTWLCSACDLCYPQCPQEIHVSDVLGAIRTLAVEAGYTTVIDTARVDEQTCVACGMCTQVCPYEAISLVEQQVAGHARTFAQVDASRCMACGLCAASCRSNSIELPDTFSSESLMSDMWGWIQDTSPYALPAAGVLEPESVEWAESVRDRVAS